MRGNKIRPELTLPDERTSSRAFSEDAALARLLRHTLETAGPREAPALLYRLGFDRGWADAAPISERFGEGRLLRPAFAGPPLPLLFLPTEGSVPADFGGVILRSREAELQASFTGRGEPLACPISAGYSAGWYSAILGETIAVLEDRCGAREAAACHFRARPLGSWRAEGNRRLLDLARYIEEPERIQTPKAPVSEGEGEMFGQFDRLSPAVHVWGPVMILPYGGVQDADTALETVRADLGQNSVRVIVVDVTAARLDAAEVCGVLELVSRLEAKGLEVLVAGVRPEADTLLRPKGGERAAPFVVRDLTEAIARAFQIAYLGDGLH